MNKNLKNQDGYALLLSVIIIATLLLMMATIEARKIQDSLFASMRLEQHTQAKYLAEGCVDSALLNLAIDGSYSGNETVVINGESCSILPIVVNVIQAEAEQDGHWYRLEVGFSPISPPTISRWERVASF